MCSGKGYLKEAYYAIFQNDFLRAIEAFKKAIRCDPTNAAYYYKLSITYSRNGAIKEAIKTAKKACEFQPHNQTYRYHLQILQAKNLVIMASEKIKNDLFTNEVEELLIQAKKLDPLNIEAYLLLGIYYGENQLLNQALNEFNQVFILDPYQSQAKNLKDYYLKLYQEEDQHDRN